jgi:hypothetical protein
MSIQGLELSKQGTHARLDRNQKYFVNALASVREALHIYKILDTSNSDFVATSQLIISLNSAGAGSPRYDPN